MNDKVQTEKALDQSQGVSPVNYTDPDTASPRPLGSIQTAPMGLHEDFVPGLANLDAAMPRPLGSFQTEPMGLHTHLGWEPAKQNHRS